MKRTMMRHSNELDKRELEYASDEDMGEDLGSNIVDEDYEEELEDGEEGV